MKLLAIDTAANFSSACIFDVSSGVVLAQECRDIGRGHAEILVQQINNCLESAGLGYQDIDRIGVAHGPGSFTGIRVGVSVARGLALSLDIPATGVSCLDACAAAALSENADQPVFCALNGNRGQLYCLSTDWHAPRLLSVEEAVGFALDSGMPICGSGAPLIAEQVKRPMKIIHQMNAMPIALYAELAARSGVTKAGVEPLYLRSADAKPQTGFALPHRL